MLNILDRPSAVTVAVSHNSDPAEAINEISQQIDMHEACFMLAFIPGSMDRDGFARALAAQLQGFPVYGCTTAGQITPNGYETNALLMISFPKRHFRCATMLVSPLKPMSIKQIAADSSKLAMQFRKTANWNRLALTFSDGLSKQEDMLVAALETGLGELPVFGGSAADALQFQETAVLHGGTFHSNAALVLLLETDLEFTGLGFDHFLPTGHQMVVTRRDPRRTAGAGNQRQPGSVGICAPGRGGGRGSVAAGLCRKPGSGPQQRTIPCARHSKGAGRRRPVVPFGD